MSHCRHLKKKISSLVSRWENVKKEVGKKFPVLKAVSVNVSVDWPLPPESLSNGLNMESNLHEGLVVQDLPSVKDEGGFGHCAVDLLVVVSLELVPLRADDESVSISAGLIGVLFYANQGLVVHSWAFVVAQVQEYLFLIHLRKRNMIIW